MMKLTLTLLGPFAATINGQSVTDFPTDKIRALLAYLAVEADKPHRRDALAALLWPDYTSSIALRNLRQSLHRLRQTLDAVDTTLSAELFTITRQTIALHSHAVVLDVAQLQAEISTVATHEHRALDQCMHCLDTLRTAVARYGGEFLVGFLLEDAVAFSEWQTLQREYCHRQVTEALQRLITAEEQQHAYGAMYDDAAKLLALEPWREEAHQWAMRALAFAGRRSDALAQYERCRAVLATELGVEPSTATTSLYEQIRQGAVNPQTISPTAVGQESSAAEESQLPATPVSLQRKATLLSHFPQTYTKFLGRTAELQQLVNYFTVEQCRLVTLIGPGGSGKTRLAVEAAHHHLAQARNFADGIVFVALATVTDATRIVPTIAAALGLQLQESSAHQDQLVDFLHNKQLLLVLDNVEQIVDGIGILVALLDACPTLAFLVTSRAALNLQREQRLPVGGLSYASTVAERAAPIAANGPAVLDVLCDASTASLDQSAVQLFVQAARQVQPGFTPTGNTLTAIVDICELVQGMPLALELAAAWVRLADCATIAQEIKRNLDFLSTPARDVPARHRSMSAVFTHSWQHIAATERRLLAQLSCFTGGFTLEAMLAVTTGSVVDLANLLDWSLIQRMGSQRYGLHELLRQFAASQLATWREAELTLPAQPAASLQIETRRRHSDYFLRFVAALADELYGAQPQQPLRTLRREVDNIRAAWQWAVDTRQLSALDQAADGFSDFLFLEGLLQEGEQAFAAAAGATQEPKAQGTPIADEPRRKSIRSHLLVRKADFLFHQGKLVEAQPLLEEALACVSGGEDILYRAEVHGALGDLLQMRGEFDEALAHLQQALTLYRELAHRRGEAQTFNSIGRYHWEQSDYDEALSCHQQALALDRALDNQIGIAQDLGSLGLVYYRQGHYEEARSCHQQALAVAEALGNRHNMAKHLNHMGVTYQDQSRFAEATACFEQALVLDRELGNQLGIAIRQTNLGLVYMRTGDQARALVCTEEAYRLLKAMEHKSGIALATGNLGVIHWRMGDYAQALALHQEALAQDEALGNQEAMARHLANMGDMYREQGLLQEALDYLTRAVEIARMVSTRYQLAESLYRKAETLLALDEIAQSTCYQQESLAIAQAIQRADTLLGCRLLAAKLHHAQREDEAAIAQLRELLQTVETKQERAAVHYTWWQLFSDSFHAKKAMALYEKLVEETPNAIYRRRLATLRAENLL